MVVGLVNDEDIIKNKGSAPVMCEEERYLALSACKWVDEVIRNAPYDLTKEWVSFFSIRILDRSSPLITLLFVHFSFFESLFYMLRTTVGG